MLQVKNLENEFNSLAYKNYCHQFVLVVMPNMPIGCPRKKELYFILSFQGNSDLEHFPGFHMENPF